MEHTVDIPMPPAASQRAQPQQLTTTNALDDDRRWLAVSSRDAGLDGTFYYGVLTTGVFCRPGCPSRRPNRANVRFYTTTDDARADGLRPCLRCRPVGGPGDDPMAERVRRLCQYIETHANSPLTLKEMSRRARLSPAHLQRSFKAVVGVSPKQYLDSCRMTAL